MAAPHSKLVRGWAQALNPGPLGGRVSGTQGTEEHHEVLDAAMACSEKINNKEKKAPATARSEEANEGNIVGAAKRLDS